MTHDWPLAWRTDDPSSGELLTPKVGTHDPLSLVLVTLLIAIFDRFCPYYWNFKIRHRSFWSFSHIPQFCCKNIFPSNKYKLQTMKLNFNRHTSIEMSVYKYVQLVPVNCGLVLILLTRFRKHVEIRSSTFNRTTCCNFSPNVRWSLTFPRNISQMHRLIKNAQIKRHIIN